MGEPSGILLRGIMPANAYPIQHTLLSLPRFARMVGLAPLHFAGATAANLNPAVFPTGTTCGDVWPRFDWQKVDQMSHESLAYAIKDAEETLAREVGYLPALDWIAGEQVMFPRDFYRTSIYQITDVRGFRKSITTKYGKIISGGQRAVALIGTPEVVYSDEDLDGLFETATITINDVTITDDICECKVYFEDMDGLEEWEIRPARIKTLVGGTLTIVMDSWLLIDPELLSVYPTDDGFTAVDVSSTDNFVDYVDVYREYNDITDPSVIFSWENDAARCTICNGVGCLVCSATEQDGCMQIRDPQAGIIVPVPATYADGVWSAAVYDIGRAPDKVELYYYAGDRSNEYLRGVSCDPLSDQWAWCIIWLTIARLERPPCSCSRINNMFDYLREDLSHSTQSGSHFLGEDVGSNPFGPHRGELMAWKRIKHHVGKRMSVAVI
jgi:hypothetical protein